jgi:EAL domain-containing protein (putative c-di-GMP-specific phosphodiesterase class I)/GGDEF domain-containing protein
LTARQEHGDGRQSLFILSSSDRDGLAEMAGQAGWRVMAARRARGAEQRFLASDAQIVLADARGVKSATALVAALAAPVVACAGALLVLVERGEVDVLPELIAAGATHFLVAPVTSGTLAAGLASARIFVERLGGGVGQVQSRHAIQRSDALVWRLDRRRALVTLSDGLARMLGLDTRDHSPAALLRRLPAADRVVALSAIRDVALSGGTAAFAHDQTGFPGRRAAHHIHVDKGGIVGEVELLPGVVRRKKNERDFLTGLGNRAAAVAWLDAACAAGTPPTVLLLSISQLDRTNAAYGQLAGDALLARLGRRIERLVEDVAGTAAIAARIAGAEFLVGLPRLPSGNADLDGEVERATFLARRLVAAVGQPFSAGDHLIRLTGRCGIAQGRGGDDATRLLRRAASALADARQSDGEGIRILTAERHSREVDSDRLEADLRLALDRGEVDIGFQPQYATSDDRIIGVEALARWTHPHYGPLGAGLLFAAAERSDFLLPLSRHIQARALALAAAWPAALSRLRMAINVTAADIAQPDFMETFLALVDGSGFPRTRLTVEITESGLIDDIEAAAALLDRMRGEGLAVAIDDFGTGYSSLAYLKSLPLDYLKIDSGLAQDIAGSARDRIIVRGVIGMAKSLGLQVVAEGVETEQQLSLLAREGCDVYQGFLRAPALESAELVQWVAAQP